MGTSITAESRLHLALPITAFVLLAFFLLSPEVEFGNFSHPPIYGYWEPVLDALAVLVVPTGLAVVIVGSAFSSTDNGPTWVWLALLVVTSVALAAAVGLVRGDPDLLTRPVSLDPEGVYYTADLHFIDQYGLRGFAQRHPELTDQFNSYASRTHPPGSHFFLHAAYGVFGRDNPMAVATLIAAIGMSGAASAWAMGRDLGGERAGRVAAALFAAAPGPLILAYASMDMVFATVLSAAVAIFLIGIHRDSVRWFVAGGLVLGLGSLLTFAVAFVALATVVAVLIETRPLRRKLRLLAGAALGGLAVIALAWVGLGIDLIASYRSVPHFPMGFQPYWVLASPTAWLIFAGVPLAAYGVVGLFTRHSEGRRPVLLLTLVVVMIAWAALPPTMTGLRPGEVERTWAFLYPVLAGVAGPVLQRSLQANRWRPGLFVGGLMVLSIAQAVLIQSLWDNLF